SRKLQLHNQGWDRDHIADGESKYDTAKIKGRGPIGEGEHQRQPGGLARKTRRRGEPLRQSVNDRGEREPTAYCGNRYRRHAGCRPVRSNMRPAKRNEVDDKPAWGDKGERERKRQRQEPPAPQNVRGNGDGIDWLGCRK